MGARSWVHEFARQAIRNGYTSSREAGVLGALTQTPLPASDRSPVVAMVSGGSDSTALLVLAARDELDLHDGRGRARVGLERLVVLHVNHLTRGAASDGDEEFVRLLCGRLGVRFESRRVDVPALVREASSGKPVGSSANFEEIAREQRYGLAWDLACAESERVGVDPRSSRILVAHTADDRAETFVMRSMTGAGLRGLSGMRAQSGVVVRPLLDRTREELRAYLRSQGIGWREDATNDEDTALRSYVRHHVTSAMRERVPAFATTLGRTLDLIGEDADLLDRLADALLARAMRPMRPPDEAYSAKAESLAGQDALQIASAALPAAEATPLAAKGEPRRVVLDARTIAHAEPALARRALLSALQAALGERDERRARPEMRHAEALLQLARSGQGRCTLPLDTDVACEDGMLTITPASVRSLRKEKAAASSGSPNASVRGASKGAGQSCPLSCSAAKAPDDDAADGSEACVFLPVPGRAAWGDREIVADVFEVPQSREADEFAREVAAQTAGELEKLCGASRAIREGRDFVLLDADKACPRQATADPLQVPTRAGQPLACPQPVPADEAHRPHLVIVATREGDRMQPWGMGGHSKLIRDILMEAGVPVEQRRSVPVVKRASAPADAGSKTQVPTDTGMQTHAGKACDRGANVVWVAGIRSAEPAAYTHDTNVLLRLQIVPKGVLRSGF